LLQVAQLVLKALFTFWMASRLLGCDPIELEVDRDRVAKRTEVQALLIRFAVRQPLLQLGFWHGAAS
jgi:Fe2+ transport system protein FeoA